MHLFHWNVNIMMYDRAIRITEVTIIVTSAIPIEKIDHNLNSIMKNLKGFNIFKRISDLSNRDNDVSMQSQHGRDAATSSTSSSWFKMSYKTRSFAEINSVDDTNNLNWIELDIPDIVGLLARATELKNDEFTEAMLENIVNIMQVKNNPEFKAQLNESNISNILDMLLSQKMASSIICTHVLRISCWLLADETVTKKFSSSGFCYRLIKTCQIHSKDESLMLWGLRVIYALTMDDMMTQKFAVSGTSELMSSVLHLYYQSKTDLIEWSCRIIYNMCYEDSSCSEKVADLGICDVIASLMISNQQDGMGTNTADANSIPRWHASVRRYQYLILAIGSICRRNDSNKERVACLGIPDTIIHIVQHFGYDDVAFAESVVWSIGNLAYPCQRNQIRFCELASCDIIMQILAVHMGSEKCAIECLRCIRNLGHVCNYALSALNAAGAATGVIKLLESYPDSLKMVQWSWYALGSLSKNPNIAHQLGDLGICKLAGDEITKYSREDDIVQWVASAVSALSQYPFLNNSLCNEGLVSLLVESMGALSSNPDVIEECCIAIAFLLHTYNDATMNDKSHSVTLADKTKFYAKQQVVVGTKICELMMKFWSKFLKSDTVIQETSKVLATLVYRPSPSSRIPSSSSSDHAVDVVSKLGNDDSIIMEKLDGLISSIIYAKLMDGNFVKLLPKILQLYLENGVIIESCFVILCELLCSDATSKLSSQLISNSLFDTLASILHYHVHVVRICALGCRIVSYLVSEQTHLTRFANSLSSSSSSFLSLDNDNSSGASTSHIDCASVLIKVLSRHYQFYYDVSDSDCVSAMPSELDVDESCMIIVDVDSSPSIRNNNTLAIDIMKLVSDFSTRNSILRSRFGLSEGCDAIMNTIRFHKSKKKIVIAGCTTISSLSSSSAIPASSDSNRIPSESFAASKRFYERDVCDLIVELLSIYQSDEETMYFLCILVGSICNFNDNRLNLCERGVCSSLIQGIQLFYSGEGFITEALSALGSLYDSGISRNFIQSQLTTIGDLQVLHGIGTRYLGHAIISQCLCRLIAFMASGPNIALQVSLHQHGFVDIVLSILDKYHEDSLDTSKFALLAVANLSYGNDGISHEMHERKICRIIVHVLQRHISRDFIVEACCRGICSGLSKYSAEFGKLGACELVLQALPTHPNTAAVLEWACRAIGVLAEDKMNVIILCDHHAPENIVATLQQHLQYESSLMQISRKVLFKSSGSNPMAVVTDSMNFGSGQTTILHTINDSSLSFGGSVAADGSSSYGFLKSVSNGLMRFGIFSSSYSNLQKSSDSTAITDGSVYWGIMAIYYMLKGSDCDSMYQQILFDSGICDIIHNILLRYEENEIISLACCKVIVTLTKNNDIISSRFGALGVCSQIVEIMQIFPSSEKIARWTNQAVALLSYNHHELNISRFASAGICETIPVAMQAHQMSSDVALYGCEAIYRITQDDSVSSGLGARFGHSGGCEAIVSVLRKHSSSANVMEMAYRALSNLALVTGNASWFGPAGACDAIVASVQIHENDANVMACCWEAISNLCQIDFNRIRLHMLGIGDMVVKSLRTHRKSSYLAENTGRLVGRLCEYRGSNTQLIGRFDDFTNFFLPSYSTDESSITGQHQPRRRFSSMQTIDSDKIHAQINSILVMAPGNRQALVAAGIIEPLIFSLRHHLNNNRVVYSIIKAISVLAHGKESISERFLLGHYDACEVIVESLRIHQHDINICIVCGHAIRALCSDNHISREFVNVSQFVVDNALSVTSSSTQEDVIYTAEDLVDFISLIQSENQRRVHATHGLELIVDVLKLHLNDQLSFSTVSSMSSSSSKSSSIKTQQRLYKSVKHTDALIEAVAWAIAKLCEEDAEVNREVLGSLGVCEILVELLNAFNKGALTFDMTFYIIMALAQLSIKNTRNVTRLGFTLIGDDISCVVNRYLQNFGVHQEGSYKQGDIPASHRDMTTNNAPQAAPDFTSDSVNDTSSDEYDILLEYIVLLAANICQDRIGQHKLGGAGFCRLSVLLLSRYDRSYNYTSLLTHIIAALAWQFPENQTRLGQAGACKGLVSVLEKHFLSNDTASSSYLNFLTSIASMKSSDSRKRNDNEETTFSTDSRDVVLFHDSEIIDSHPEEGSNDNDAESHATSSLQTTDSARDDIAIGSDDHEPQLIVNRDISDVARNDQHTSIVESAREEHNLRSSILSSYRNLTSFSNNEMKHSKSLSPSASMQNIRYHHYQKQLYFRPSLFIDGFAAVAALAKGHESNRAKLQASSILDILTTFLSVDDATNRSNILIGKACAKDAMDSIICD